MIIKKINKWKLTAHYPYTPIQQRSMETGAAHSPVFAPIDAAVPGSVYMDLMKAGIIENPYYDMNSLKCEWVPQRWWIYNTNVTIPDEYKNRNIRIRFSGIDYRAHISMNKKILTETPHEGMFLPFEKDVTNIINFGGENNIQAVLESAPDEMGQIGYTSRTYTQKSRYNYKWDFCTRMIGVGLYDDVTIEHFGSAAIDCADIKCAKMNGAYSFECGFEFTAFRDADVKIACELCFGGKTVKTIEYDEALKTGKNCSSVSIPVENPQLWNVNGYGKQNLYDLKVTVTDKTGGISDCREYKTGMRTLEYACCDGREEALPYIPIVNGRKIYIKGVNMSPCDLMIGCISYDKMRKLLFKAKQSNINLIRVWGGGRIESEDFYSLCDEYGIMVWQEFIQSSSGIDNIPSKRPEFLNLLEKVSTEALKTKRNHVSLTFWSGGNELMDEKGVPSTYEDENIALLKSLCGKYDPLRLMLPTSASGPNEFISPEQKGRNHDVHGHWKYLGEEHYKFYNGSDSLLHSEFGCDGMTNPDKVSRFLSSPNHKIFAMSENDVWRHHGEWWDTLARDTEIFGEFDRNDLLTFIKASQLIQAEGIRYILEANQRRMFKNAGSIIWQYNEPYPNISCTSLNDYWGDPKLAMFFVGLSYRMRNVTLKYDALRYNEGDQFNGEIYIINHLNSFDAIIDIKVADEDGSIILNKTTGVNSVPDNGAVKLCDLNFTIGNSPCYNVALVLDDGEKAVTSNYFFFVRDKNGICSKNSAAAIYDEYKNKRGSDFFTNF